MLIRSLKPTANSNTLIKAAPVVFMEYFLYLTFRVNIINGYLIIVKVLKWSLDYLNGFIFVIPLKISIRH